MTSRVDLDAGFAAMLGLVVIALAPAAVAAQDRASDQGAEDAEWVHLVHVASGDYLVAENGGGGQLRLGSRGKAGARFELMLLEELDDAALDVVALGTEDGSHFVRFPGDGRVDAEATIQSGDPRLTMTSEPVGSRVHVRIARGHRYLQVSRGQVTALAAPSGPAEMSEAERAATGFRLEFAGRAEEPAPGRTDDADRDVRDDVHSEPEAVDRDEAERYRVQVQGTVGNRGRARGEGIVYVSRAGGSRIVVELQGLDEFVPVQRLEGVRRGSRFTAKAPVQGADDVVAIQGALEDDRITGTLVRSTDGGIGSRLALRGQRTAGQADREEPDARETPPVLFERPDPVLTPTRELESVLERLRRNAEEEDQSVEVESSGELAAEFTTIFFVPPRPTDEQQVSFNAIADPAPGQEVARIEVSVDDGATVLNSGPPTPWKLSEVRAGPFDAGGHTVELVAVGPDGRRSEPVRRSLQVRHAGSAVVKGRVRGAVGSVVAVELIDPAARQMGLVFAREEPGRDGRFRFSSLPADTYWVHVVTRGIAEDDVRPSSTVRLDVDGRSTYTQDFDIE